MKWSLICSGILFCLTGSIQAQGLIWTLPEDGSWVRYEGTYTQLIRRPDSPEGDLTLTWRRLFTIKSVGSQTAEYQGKEQPCRWIEIKCETGKIIEGVLEAGPGGIRMYKLLVPESVIQGKIFETVHNDHTIFISMIPIVKGFRKIGDEAAQPIESGVFNLYPLVSLLRHYQDFSEAGPATSEKLPAGEFESTPYSGKMDMESFSERSRNTCEISRSGEIPFGVTKWTAKTTIENKGSTDDRSTFQESLTVTEEMQAAATGVGAESDFLDTM